jgi:hypothetical protein
MLRVLTSLYGLEGFGGAIHTDIRKLTLAAIALALAACVQQADLDSWVGTR